MKVEEPSPVGFLDDLRWRIRTKRVRGMWVYVPFRGQVKGLLWSNVSKVFKGAVKAPKGIYSSKEDKAKIGGPVSII